MKARGWILLPLTGSLTEANPSLASAHQAT